MAYLRTSLSLVTVGIAVTQLFRLNTSPGTVSESEVLFGKIIGAAFVILGLLFILFGAIRFKDHLIFCPFYLQVLLFASSNG